MINGSRYAVELMTQNEANRSCLTLLPIIEKLVSNIDFAIDPTRLLKELWATLKAGFCKCFPLPKGQGFTHEGYRSQLLWAGCFCAYGLISNQVDIHTHPYEVHLVENQIVSRPKWGKVKAVAGMACVSISTVWRHSKTGLLPQPKKIGGSTLWNLDEVQAAIAAAGGITDEDRERARQRAGKRAELAV